MKCKSYNTTNRHPFLPSFLPSDLPSSNTHTQAPRHLPRTSKYPAKPSLSQEKTHPRPIPSHPIADDQSLHHFRSLSIESSLCQRSCNKQPASTHTFFLFVWAKRGEGERYIPVSSEALWHGRRKMDDYVLYVRYGICSRNTYSWSLGKQC